MNNREEQIEKASVEYQLSKRPMAIGGDVFADEVYRMNINPSFISGAEWADEHPNEQMIAKYLFEKKGYPIYPIDLNGNLPSFKDMMKDIEQYNQYKKKQWIDKVCEWIYNNAYSYVDGQIDIEDIHKVIEE